MKHIAPLLAALASAALIGCTASAGDTPSADGPIRIAPFITRVSGPNFDPGDCIGLTVELPGSRYADNAPLTYDGKVFSSPDLIWYNDLHETSTLYAYYPYQAEATPARFTVRTDQRNAADYGASDLLAAVREAVTPAETAIDMRFDHLLSRLVVHIDNRSSAAAERVLIAGTVGTAEVNIATQHAAADATAPTVEIIARETDSGKTFDAILVPPTVKLTVVLLTSDGKRHEKTLDEARELRQGSRYTLDVIATDIDIALSLGGEIGDWDDGGSLDPAEEPAGEIRHGDATYRTHTFPDGTTWMAENLRYLPAGTTPSENPAAQAGVWFPCSSDLQPAQDEETIRTQGYLYDLTTAAGGVTLTDEIIALLEGVQGICPDGWHLPTQNDLERLVVLLEDEPDLTDTFMTRTGIRTASGSYSGQHVGGAFSKGYLLGSSPCTGSVNGTAKFSYLCIQPDGTMTTVDYLPEAGVPVRCVHD